MPHRCSIGSLVIFIARTCACAAKLFSSTSTSRSTRILLLQLQYLDLMYSCALQQNILHTRIGHWPMALHILNLVQIHTSMLEQQHQSFMFSTVQACAAVGTIRREICQMNRFQGWRIPMASTLRTGKLIRFQQIDNTSTFNFTGRQDPYKQTIMITKRELHVPCPYNCTKFRTTAAALTTAVGTYQYQGVYTAASTLLRIHSCTRVLNNNIQSTLQRAGPRIQTNIEEKTKFINHFDFLNIKWLLSTL